MRHSAPLLLAERQILAHAHERHLLPCLASTTHQASLLALRGGSIDGGALADLLISVIVLLAVALAARSANTVLAAVFSTAPSGVPLSLWLVHRAARASGGAQQVETFLVAVIKGGLALSSFALGALALCKLQSGLEAPSLTVLLGAGFTSWALAWSLLQRV